MILYIIKRLSGWLPERYLGLIIGVITVTYVVVAVFCMVSITTIPITIDIIVCVCYILLFQHDIIILIFQNN